ncbi:MAG TPA: NAD kinase [Sediminibacterium sp.]|jgi:NAD+ kinase|uniref:NAD kinase n=1 Tax=Sediminibacterium sp. TaxID=1917865 RepID=UPI0008D259D6|nr:NAD kinase [Sediminibacterium sp.]OHC86500.1 MAG: NAD kinase [Sphingobacteriia bacterium RIFOXYC2_FULL_35_18]OHC90012.1 MAG: NAD kinase [Sphingobacteriia bacterium RIFOXYD2_FULL_35_12]OYY10780.1 MAG: NAD kinase [Sphingobacteriia bacterium 35-36-14]OYZ55139.1 MAG: NAD kinase [Sphingobacteriia bacterium 24-36-13]OZA64450.1 MAG: NAD kinase [Sphingobacteriia bacterium 39-36-14]
MKVAIYSRGLDIEQENPLLILLEELNRHDTEILLFNTLFEQFNIPQELCNKIQQFSGYEDLGESVDCVISLGGDGTMLDTITLIREKNIPVLGINFGRLGFLASISREELATAVDALVNHTFIIDKRTLIHLDSNTPLFADAPFALNEFTIHKKDTSPMIKIHTYMNGEFLNTYWADGLIVSTPTGSTGYNLSCNGPILFPDSSSLVITPICPHNLNVRSIVIPDNNIISFEVEGRADEFIVAMDARRELVPKSVQLAVRKEAFNISLIRLNENTFLSTLRTKLTWGLDKRN